MAYKTVLAAIDLSEESAQVLDAARLITDHSAGLHVLTVIKPLTQVYGGLDMAPIAIGTVSFEDEALTQARQQLVEVAATCGITEDNVHVVIGAPSHEIRELAVSLNADLIVVGSHGRHGLGLLLGSTANAVLHGVQSDVLSVRVSYDQ